MKSRWLLCVGALCAFSAAVGAFINPSFTPIDLVEQSESILLLEFTEVKDSGEVTAAVREALKGESEQTELTIDLLAGAFEAQGRGVMELIKQGNRQGMLFAGSYSEGEAGMGFAAGPAGYLHVGGYWAVLAQWEDIWEMEKTDPRMLGTWAGSTDMLLRAVRYIMEDPEATVPVVSGVSWAPEVLVAQTEGQVSEVAPIDLDLDGGTALFLAGSAGDRLFRYSDDGMAEITDALGLDSTSRLFAWGDFNGDDRLDLISWDGAALSLHARQADGTFAASPLDAGGALEDGCLSLQAVGTADGRTVLVAGTPGMPMLLTPSADGLDVRPLAEGEIPSDDLGEAGECFVADFDGDAVPDALQLWARGGLFYKGAADGTFAAPIRTDAATGGGRHGAALGDYDADGLLDVAVAGEVRNRIWQNQGEGRFAEMIDQSGEIAYIAKAGGVDADTGDFNNDGRQDILITYGTRMPPHPFFNRGFRSFGHARMVDLAQQKLLPQAGEGQQAACLGDFNGDGALDMVLVLKNGEVWMFPRQVEGGPALAVRPRLPAESAFSGPVNVLAWHFDRALGAWPLRVGEAPPLVGVPEAGLVMLRWQRPGGERQQREVIVEDGPVGVVLGD